MLPRLIALAVVSSLVAAAPAAADSIAYVKSGDVWLASPDGARQQQVTHSGAYAYVSQADDGTMIALAGGERLHKLSRTGQVLADFPTYVSDGAPVSGGVNQFHGPFAPEISPDGSKVAFEWLNDTFEDAPGCSDQTVPPCAVYRQSQGVGITSSSGYTGFEAHGLLTGWISPQWISEDTLLRSDPGAILADDTAFTQLGSNAVDPWFWDDNQGLGVKDVELSRDQRVAVGIAGFNDEKLRVYRPLMSPFGAPDWDHTPFTTKENVHVVQQCDELGGKFESTTLAPSGRALAYGTAEGIYVAALPDACAPGGPGALVIPGGRFPDWGPADIPTAAAFEPTPVPVPSPPPGSTKKKLALAVTKSGKVTVTVPAAGKVKVTVKRKRRTVASLSKTAKAAGKVTFKLKTRGKVTVTASFAKQKASKTLTLRG